MTTVKNGIKNTRQLIPQFNAIKQLEFFESLKNSKFSGQLEISDTNDNSWTFYLYLGRIIYGTGGTHPTRRWRRNLVSYCPQRLAHFDEIQEELFAIPEEACRISCPCQSCQSQPEVLSVALQRVQA